MTKQSFKYLIIGGGMAADAAVHGIREVDATGSIGIISSDSDPPYDRPPLTKSLWKDKTLDSVWRHTETQRVDLHLGRKATVIDAQSNSIVDDHQDVYTYDMLLLATGGTPRRLPFGNGSIIYFRYLNDYRRLRALTEKGRRFAVIGGGFIGSELAAALSMNQKEVVLLFPGRGICDRVFPGDLSHFVDGVYRQKGVELLPGEKVAGVEQRDGQLVVKTESKRQIVVDGIVAGLGITPNVELARMAGLQVENGIVVDELLRTSRQNIFAAGDVAAFYSPALGKRLRVEHEDNANTMGRLAGRNMAGKAEPYQHLPFFYSDLFELGYEAVGELDARLEVTARWKDRYHEGILYYQREGRVTGVLLWNVWGQVDSARKLIAEKATFRAEDLKQTLAKAA